MELTQLFQFCTIARSKTMTEAAEKLGVTQPALSAVVKKLERELGTALFERTRNSITINEAGKLALHHAETILNDAEAMKRAFAAYHQPLVVGLWGDAAFAATGALLHRLPSKSALTFRPHESQSEGERCLSAGETALLLTEDVVKLPGVACIALENGCQLCFLEKERSRLKEKLGGALEAGGRSEEVGV